LVSNSVIISSPAQQNKCCALNRFAYTVKIETAASIYAALSRDYHRGCKISARWNHYYWSDL